MLDKLLAFGSSFDWVTPLRDLYKDLNNGPHHDFYISRYSHWSAGKIERLLKGRGVAMWGLSYTDDMITIRVRETQARWAQYLLLEEEVPVIGGLLEGVSTYNSQPRSKSESKKTKNRKKQKRKSNDPLEPVDNFLDSLGKSLGL